MTRRTIVLLVTLALGFLAPLLTAAAPTPGKMPRIGVLEFGSPPASPDWQTRSVFLQELRTLGWLERQNLMLEYRWADVCGRYREATYARLQGDWVLLARGQNGACRAPALGGGSYGSTGKGREFRRSGSTEGGNHLVERATQVAAAKSGQILLWNVGPPMRKGEAEEVKQARGDQADVFEWPLGGIGVVYMWGARLSLYVGLVSVSIDITVGALWGILTGY
jgi:hypothetical protein